MSVSKADATQTVLSNFGEKVDQLDQNVKKSNRMVLFAVLSAGALVGAQFVSTIVAQEWTKEIKAEGAQLTDVHGHMLSVESSYTPVTGMQVLTPAYLRSLKEVAMNVAGGEYYTYQTVLGSEFRPCPVSGSECCQGNDAYVIHTAGGVFAATQTKHGINVMQCRDEAFLAGLKQAPETQFKGAKRALLAFDGETYDVSIDGEGGCTISWGRDESRCSVGPCLDNDTGDFGSAAAKWGVPDECVHWTDAAGNQHQSHNLAQNTHDSAGVRYELHRGGGSLNTLRDYCQTTTIGNFNKDDWAREHGNAPWFGPKINLCTSEALLEDFWVNQVADAKDGRLDFWASSDTLFWHRYDYGAFWGGYGLADQCLFCFACQDYIPASPGRQTKFGRWNYFDNLQYESPEDVPIGGAVSADRKLSYPTAKQAGETWWKDSKHSCTEHVMQYVYGLKF
jgi:hypothetical protein